MATDAIDATKDPESQITPAQKAQADAAGIAAARAERAKTNPRAIGTTAYERAINAQAQPPTGLTPQAKWDSMFSTDAQRIANEQQHFGSAQPTSTQQGIAYINAHHAGNENVGTVIDNGGTGIAGQTQIPGGIEVNPRFAHNTVQNSDPTGLLLGTKPGILNDGQNPAAYAHATSHQFGPSVPVGMIAAHTDPVAPARTTTSTFTPSATGPWNPDASIPAPSLPAIPQAAPAAQVVPAVIPAQVAKKPLYQTTDPLNNEHMWGYAKRFPRALINATKDAFSQG